MPRTQYWKNPIWAWEISALEFAAIVAWCHPDASSVTDTTITLDNVQGGIGDFVVNDENGMFKIMTNLELIRFYQDEVSLDAANVSLPEFGSILVNGVQVLSDQVPAIGLDAKSDADKITDLIAALRAHGIIGPNA